MNEPNRNAIGKMIRLARPDAPSEVLVAEPANRPMAVGKDLELGDVVRGVVRVRGGSGRALAGGGERRLRTAAR
jgi:hypothetical protein